MVGGVLFGTHLSLTQTTDSHEQCFLVSVQTIRLVAVTNAQSPTFERKLKRYKSTATDKIALLQPALRSTAYFRNNLQVANLKAVSLPSASRANKCNGKVIGEPMIAAIVKIEDV